MFLTQKIPRIHSHFLISTLTSPKPTKIFSITSSLLSKSGPGPGSGPESIPLAPPLSHFSTLTPTVAAPSLPHEQVGLQLSLETLFVPPETDVSSPLSARILKGSNIVLGKYAGDGVEVVNADFVKSSVKTEDCPSDGKPEFALVGRSNVGKSSLLNSLVRRKKLALTSKKPWKTQCINHFRINESWYLVDLPGYGYANAPHDVRTDWAKFTKDYFINRPTLVSVFLLIDASIPAKNIDLEYASWLGQNQIPMTLVAPPWIMTSSVTNKGRDEILLHMSQQIEEYTRLIASIKLEIKMGSREIEESLLNHLGVKRNGEVLPKN